MGTSIDESRREGYRRKIENAKAKKDSISQRVTGSGNYASTDLSQTFVTVYNYISYLQTFANNLTPCTNPFTLFPESDPKDPIVQDQFQNFLFYSEQKSVALEHLAAAKKVRDHWIARKEYLKDVKTALYYWKDWNISIHDFLEKGVVEKNDTNLISVDYSTNNHDTNIKSDNLRDYFTLLEKYQLYGPGCKVKTAQEAEKIKDREAVKAQRSLSSVLEVCDNNRKEARSCIENLKVELASIESLLASLNQIIMRFGCI